MYFLKIGIEEDGLCMNMKPKLETLSFELKF